MSLRMRPESNRYCSPVTGEMAHCVALKRADCAKPPSPEYPGSGRPRVRAAVGVHDCIAQPDVGSVIDGERGNEGTQVQRVGGAAVNRCEGAVIVHAKDIVGGRPKIGAGEVDIADRICADAAEGGGSEARRRDAGLRGQGDDGFLFAVRGDANQVKHAHEQDAALGIDGEFAGAECGRETGGREFAIGRDVVGTAEVIEHVEAALGVHDDGRGRCEVLGGIGCGGQRGSALTGAGGGGEQAVGADLADETGSEFGDEQVTGAIEGDAGGIEQPGVAGGCAIGGGLGCGAGESLTRWIGR